MEKLELRRLSSQAKIIGTIVSISGALVVVLYKGPKVINTVSPAISLNSLFDPLSSSQSNWVIGGGLLAADYVIVSIWYIMQVQHIHLLIFSFIFFMYKIIYLKKKLGSIS